MEEKGNQTDQNCEDIKAARRVEAWVEESLLDWGIRELFAGRVLCCVTKKSI